MATYEDHRSPPDVDDDPEMVPCGQCGRTITVYRLLDGRARFAIHIDFGTLALCAATSGLVADFPERRRA